MMANKRYETALPMANSTVFLANCPLPSPLSIKKIKVEIQMAIWHGFKATSMPAINAAISVSPGVCGKLLINSCISVALSAEYEY